MFSKFNIKNVKWISILGAILNIVLSIIFFIGLYQAISNIEAINALQNGVSEVQYSLYRTYSLLINLTSVTIAFSLLLISSSLRIDQIYIRLKWINILSSIFSAITTFVILFTSLNNNDSSVLKIQSPLIYVLLAISVICMIFDQIRLYFKYKNNPFYHNGKFKSNSSQFNYRYTTSQPNQQSEDGYITPRPREENKIIEEENVFDNNMSYFEMYEKRSEELHKVEEEFDRGEISEAEYNAKRKAIYAKYDKYN